MTDSPPPPDVHVDHVDHDGVRTRVTRVAAAEDASSEDAADVRSFVLIAGVGVAATYFEFLAPTLAQRGDVYALDLPGFAGMRRPDAQPTAAYLADHVEAVLDHYGLSDPVLIGHSMGTQVVTEVLNRRRITHAVLVGPVVDESESGAVTQAVRFAQSTVHESLHLALTALSAYLLCGVVYFLTVLPHMLRYRLTERIAGPTTRLLLVRGEYDRSSSRRFHSRLVAAATDAVRWEIEGAAHSVINGHALGVAHLTTRHIDGVLPRRGRMPSAEAELPPARYADARMVWDALCSRALEWWSAARRDERGVARAKARHARTLWRAYVPERESSRRG